MAFSRPLSTALLLAASSFVFAQPAERITRAVDRSVTVKLTGNRHPLARPEFDRGAVESEEPIERMMLVLAADPATQGELDQLTEAQQDPASPQYHQWITPEEYGQRFGVSEGDLNRITAWLEGEGFQVEEIPAGQRLVIFSGSAAQVSSAFHTEIHRYLVDGAMRRANADAPEIPEALAGVVLGIASLNDFESQSALSHIEPASAAPDFTSGSSHYMAPADFATIYDVNSLYSANIDGTGTSIAVVARSNLKLADVQAFRATMGLPANLPTVILNGPDPGVLSSDQAEATLDVEWAGAVARKAAVKVVVSKSTAASDGVTLSAQYIVNHKVAPVMTTSYSACEAAAGYAYAQFWSSLWQQAAPEGITSLIASGDSGAAGCDAPSATTSHYGKSVNVLCSTPYSTCVGGTEFKDANPGLYWSATASKTTLGSALSYIPEAVWNESGTVAGGSQLWASGGGTSIFFAKPSWQAGNGVPSDSWRHVPDVSVSAASHDGYLMYMNNGLYAAAGTSASSPSWAGMMALVNQQSGTSQGNANPSLYGLFQLQTAGHAAVFHVITSGSNSVPGTPGYSASSGYNQATGLGSPDAFMLVQHWKDASTLSSALSKSH